MLGWAICIGTRTLQKVNGSCQKEKGGGRKVNGSCCALIQARAYGSGASKILTSARLTDLAEQAEEKEARTVMALLMIIEHQCQRHEQGQYTITSWLEQLIGDGLRLLLGIAALGCPLSRAPGDHKDAFLDTVTQETLDLPSGQRKALVDALTQGAGGIEMLFQGLIKSVWRA